MILKIAKRCFQDTKNVFNNIVVNKLKTVDSTYLSKLFYLLNLGVYLYYYKNFHHSNLKPSSIPLSLSTHKKVIYRFYTLLFINIFKKKSQKIEIVS